MDEAGYRNEGYTVTDVSSQNLGWDLRVQQGKTVLCVEVKGETGPKPDFFPHAERVSRCARPEGLEWCRHHWHFSEEPEWHELSAADVVAAALPTQY
jgi:hypothetical protein